MRWVGVGNGNRRKPNMKGSLYRRRRHPTHSLGTAVPLFHFAEKECYATNRLHSLGCTQRKLVAQKGQNRAKNFRLETRTKTGSQLRSNQTGRQENGNTNY